MYKISLPDMSDDTRDFNIRVPKDKPLFRTTLGKFSSDLEIHGTLVRRDEDFFIVHVEARTEANVPCRRCLKTCEIDIHVKKDLYIKRGTGEDDEEDADSDLIQLEAEKREIDLEKPLHELIMLEFPVYPLCSPDCKGLCAQCGSDLNKSECGCTAESIDPRWDALRGLIDEKDGKKNEQQ
jgi:uncharacterized protein